MVMAFSNIMVISWADIEGRRVAKFLLASIFLIQM